MIADQATRTRLIEAASKAIDDGGVQSVRIREICKAAATHAPSVYYFFGDLQGLINAAQANRYLRGANTLEKTFADAVYDCKSKNDFTKIAHKLLAEIFSPKRASARAVRVSVLGSAQSEKDLAKVVCTAQDASNKTMSDALLFAQSKGWVKDDFDTLMFRLWLIGMINGRVLIELDGPHPKEEEWDVMATRTVCQLLGIPEPRGRKRLHK